jgi:hypothetical protein
VSIGTGEQIGQHRQFPKGYYYLSDQSS